MKKLIKFIAGLAATASILLAVSCKNQADYVEDTTALNNFNVLGLVVTGLDKSYNGADICLKVADEFDEDGTIANYGEYCSGKVADSYTDTTKGETVGYQSGTAYIKLDEPAYYPGDELKTSKFTCYLTVGNTDIKVLSADGTSLEDAKLDVPTSPAGTSKSDLKAKWIVVNVNNGIGTFSFADNADEPINVTLYQISFDILDVAEDSLPKGVTIITSSKTGTNSKYTLRIKGLKENAGTEVVLGGADISITDADLGNNWYDDKKFKQTISDDGVVEWTFYGAGVNGGNPAGWARTYDAAVAGPEIVINKADSEKKENGIRLLQSNVSREGVPGKSENFMFPGYTVGKDVVMEIDVEQLADASKTKADPVTPDAEFFIDGFMLYSPDSSKISDINYVKEGDGAGGGADKPIKWLPKEWDNDPQISFKTLNSNGNVGFYRLNEAGNEKEPLKVLPCTTAFKLGVQVANADWSKKVAVVSTQTLFTEDYVDGHYIYVIDCPANIAYLYPVDAVDMEIEATYRNVIVTGTQAFSEAIGLIGVEGDWTNDIAGTSSAENKTYTFDVTSKDMSQGFKIRSVGSWSGAYNIGPATGSITPPNAIRDGQYDIKVAYDSTAKTYEIKLEKVVE